MGRPNNLDIDRVKVTTTLDRKILHKAKIRAAEEGCAGVNEIIEKALIEYLKKEVNECT